jgi:hypothetical protein
MTNENRKRLLVFGLGVVVLILGFVILRNMRGVETAPSTSGYYTGPMLNKRGDLVTEDGRIIQRASPETARPRPGVMTGAQ